MPDGTTTFAHTHVTHDGAMMMPLVGWVARVDDQWVMAMAVCIWGSQPYVLVAPAGDRIRLVDRPEMKVGYPT